MNKDNRITVKYVRSYGWVTQVRYNLKTGTISVTNVVERKLKQDPFEYAEKQEKIRVLFEKGVQKCTNCHKTLLLKEFGIDNRNNGNGYRWQCKKCRANMHQKNMENPEYYFMKCRSSAKTRKLKFNLPLNEFISLITASCYYCGKKGSIYNGVDRVDSSKGYIKGNCVPCCTRCNIAKMDCTIEQFEEDTSRRFIYTITKPFQTMPPIDITKILK